MRILVAEDESRVAGSIRDALTGEGFAVDVAPDGRTALRRLGATTYDVIVLDVMLPDQDGLTVCRAARAGGVTAPILMLSARGLVEDRVRGLDAGADDYLAKPFAFSELAARVRALLRRRGDARLVPLRVGDLVLDPVTRAVRRGGRAIDLTSREFDLLDYLMRHSGQTVTRQMLAEHVWDMHGTRLTNVIDVFVNHLRRKIERPEEARLIQTVRGLGYVIREPDGLA